MNTTELGAVGEDAAAAYLKDAGYQVIARNWKTKICEIDIIARKQGRVYFVEVKTRQDTRYGGGAAAITPKKLQQMSFAAELWVYAHRWSGAYQLSVLIVDAGTITFVEDL